MALADTEQTVVVIAIDASYQAQNAIEYYLEHLHKTENKIVLVHVIELPEVGHSRQVYLSPAALAKLWQEEHQSSKQLEVTYRDIMRNKGLVGVKLRTEGGVKPGQIICSVAADEKATMVVMGTRGMGKLRRTILGSVSDYVVHHATCPVVVCKFETDSSKQQGDN